MDNLTEDYDSTITKEELRRKYSIYCREHRIIPQGDKHIKKLLIEKIGAWEDRDQTTGKQISIWKGVKFKSMDSRGILPLRENVKKPIELKTFTSSTTLTSEEEFIVETPKNLKEQIISFIKEKERSEEEIIAEFGTANKLVGGFSREVILEVLDKLSSDGVIFRKKHLWSVV